MASEVKYAYITGETTFLYNSERNIIGSNKIVLTADLANVSVSQWQYKNPEGNFVAFPITEGNNTSNSSATLNVYATESNIWVDRTATIKLLTNDSSVYDIHQIVKVYDGAAGNSNVVCSLTNESTYVPASDNGTVLSYASASTEIHIYEGGEDVTFSGNWTITYTESSGISGVYAGFDSSGQLPITYTVTSLTEDVGYVDFVCTKGSNSMFDSISKRFTVTKVRAGADGEDAVFYEVEADTYVMNLNESGVFSPASVTFNAFSKTGEQLTRSNYSGRFMIQTSTDGIHYTDTPYTSTVNEYTKTYTPTSTSIKNIKCTLYAASSSSIVLDEQTIVITRDGISGQDGSDGTPGISMGLGNYQDVIPCTSGGLAATEKYLTIPFYAYSGITRIPVTATVSSGALPGGVTVSTNTAGTTSADGTLILKVANGANFGNASLMSGQITISLRGEYNGQYQSVEQKYTWTKNNKAVDGTSSCILQIYSEDGGIIRNSTGTTTLKIRMVSGANTVTPTSVQWSKFQSGNYEDISDATETSLLVTAAMVDDLAFFKASAVYNGTTYEAYYTVDDLADPYVSYTFCSVPEFKNNTGCGAIYCRIYRNNEEVDPIKSTIFSETPPQNPVAGDFYYHLDRTNKTCVLKKYSGSTWGNATETDDLIYRYYRRNSSGDLLDTSAPYKTQRVIYVDPTIINGRMLFICEVSEE